MWQFRTTLSLPEKSATRAASTGFLRKLVGRETDARGVALPPAGGQERTINQALSLFGASSSWEFRRVCQQFLGKSGESDLPKPFFTQCGAMIAAALAYSRSLLSAARTTREGDNSLCDASSVASDGSMIAKETEHFPSCVRASRLGIRPGRTATRPSVASSVDAPLL